MAMIEGLEGQIERVREMMDSVLPDSDTYATLNKHYLNLLDRYCSIYKEANNEHRIDIDEANEKAKIKQAHSEQVSKAKLENRKMDIQLKIAEKQNKLEELRNEQAKIEAKREAASARWANIGRIAGIAVSAAGVGVGVYSTIQAGKRDKERWNQTNSDYANTASKLITGATKLI